MNRTKIAKELVRLAKELVAIEFDTEEQKKKYQQEHSTRPGTKLTVKKTKKAPEYGSREYWKQFAQPKRKRPPKEVKKKTPGSKKRNPDIVCPYCNNNRPRGSRRCPHCGNG